MALIAVPAGLGFAEAEWTLTTPYQNNSSGWTGAKRGAVLPGAEHWTASLTFAGIGLGHQRAAPIRSFLAKLKGSVNRFRVPVAIDQHRLAITPTVKAGAVAGLNYLTVQGLPATTAILPEGYYISVIRPNGVAQLLILTAALTSDSSGEAIALFEPPLLQAPPAGSGIETLNPFCEVSLSASKVSWKQGRSIAHSFNTIDVEEVV